MEQNHGRTSTIRQAFRSTFTSITINAGLAVVKGVAGVLGNSYALVADAIESGSDVISSFVVYLGLRVATVPASEKHPFGRGRAESLAAAAVAGALIIAAAAIVVSSIHEIKTPHHTPEPFTLLVLVVVVIVKEFLFRYVLRVSQDVGSSALKSDAWHHRSDALTSIAAFIGILIALIGGPGYESADDWAALVASAVIAFNGATLLRAALSELTDAAPDSNMTREVRRIAEAVPGVRGTHRCWVRKHGFDHFVELDLLVDGDISVRDGHAIAHRVYQSVVAELPMVRKVLVHVEPSDEFGRFKLEWE